MFPLDLITNDNDNNNKNENNNKDLEQDRITLVIFERVNIHFLATKSISWISS